MDYRCFQRFVVDFFWRSHRLALVLCLVAALPACQQVGSPAADTPSAAATRLPTQATSPTADSKNATPPPAADVIIAAVGFGQPSVVYVGQIIGLLSPDNSTQWQIDFSETNLLALTPPDQMNQPGPAGWRFKAVQAGDVQIVLTGTAPVCSNPPCAPPNPKRFIVKFQILTR